jgi:hypothetical protein
MSEGMLMNAEIVRRKVMQYREQEFLYELDNIDLETEAIRQQEQAKSYRRKRPLRSNRQRKSKASASDPGCGIAGRRNHRWTW